MTAATSAKIISRVLLRAASNRISLVCSGAAAFGGLAFESSTLGLLALAGYVTSIAVALGRRDLWRGVADDLRRRPIELPHPCTFAEVAPREFLLRLSNARSDRIRAESSLSASARAEAQPLTEKASQMEETTLRLLDLLDQMSRHLGCDATGPMRLEIRRLEERSRNASLPTTRVEYQRAIAALNRRLETLERTEAWKGLVVAKLETIIGALEGLPSRLLQLQLWRSTAVALEESPPLDTFSDQLETLEEAAATASEPLQIGSDLVHHDQRWRGERSDRVDRVDRGRSVA